MEIDEIVDYATKSPENTNPAVLRSMLSQLNGGSGGGVMWVNITVTGEGIVSYSADKTNAEIYSAVNSGKMVFCRVGMGDVSGVCSLVYFAPNSARFSQTYYYDGSAHSEQIDIDNDVVNWTAWTWTVEDDS